MNTLEKRPVGRPRAEIDLDRVRELAGLGLTSEQIAARLGISRRTLFARLEEDPAAREAMEAGLAEAVEVAASTLFDMAIRERNVACLIFWLKCRGQFSLPRPPAVAISVSADAPLAISEHVFEMAERQRALLDVPDPDGEG
jgi:transcriptional regulator with XRE-family HTH domain